MQTRMTFPKIPYLFTGHSGSQDKKEELKNLLERLGQILKGLDPWLTDNLNTFAKNLSFLPQKEVGFFHIKGNTL